MYQYRNEIDIRIIIVGYDDNAIEVTRKLEPLLIGKYSPSWNVEFNR
jgi:hypothetical protein